MLAKSLKFKQFSILSPFSGLALAVARAFVLLVTNQQKPAEKPPVCRKDIWSAEAARFKAARSAARSPGEEDRDLANFAAAIARQEDPFGSIMHQDRSDING